jgi:hypothetical protein
VVEELTTFLQEAVAQVVEELVGITQEVQHQLMEYLEQQIQAEVVEGEPKTTPLGVAVVQVE